MYPLENGEELLWSGRPQRYPRRYSNYHGYVVWAVGALAVLAVAIVASVKFGVGLVLVGAWTPMAGVLLGLVIERNRQRKGQVGVMTYLVTDRRIVFVAERSTGIEHRWEWLADLRAPRVHRYRDGTGTVDFHPTFGEWFQDQRYRAQPSAYPILPELVAIEDPERVADLLAAARSSDLAERSAS